MSLSEKRVIVEPEERYEYVLVEDVKEAVKELMKNQNEIISLLKHSDISPKRCLKIIALIDETHEIFGDKLVK